MKKPPPPPRLHKQEPSYQSPPRPPPLLHQDEPSLTQPPSPQPPLHQQEPSPGSTSLPSISPPELSNPQDLQSQPPTSSIPHCDGGPLKRPRFDLGIPHSVNDSRTIGYDIYQRSVQAPSLPSEELGRFNGLGGMGRPGGDGLYIGGGAFPSDSGPNGTRDIGSGQQDLGGRPSRELLPPPPDASSTLFVEGLPSDCSMREVAHIFRPFSGYREVRLVTTDSEQRDGDPVVLCFVDFENPASAATARNALQGYRMDEEEPDSESLQIQFSRNTGPRPGQRGGRR
ncbi:nuclear speckle RNA-binding protein B-like isoform X1 [Raphanus sativus]|uniref:Nuclear speckle RNA-binding protein B-like isoform X1 n=1 Tax=Raphanus sativus TaxID=3726 RepID=A0A9W3CTH2_RAPSA|nr:nuclear speckle RNA-binding protein B-like isoform X1 [Raphanus sativus]